MLFRSPVVVVVVYFTSDTEIWCCLLYHLVMMLAHNVVGEMGRFVGKAGHSVGETRADDLSS